MQIAITPTDQAVELHNDGTWKYSIPKERSIDKLKAMVQPKEAVDMFSGLFDRLGVHIKDTDRKITCVHKGERIEFEEGIDPNMIDFCVEIYSYQIDRVVDAVANEYKDDLARFRLLIEFFPVSNIGRRNALNNPMLSNPIFRWLIRGKNLVHIYFPSPDREQEKDATFTLIFVNGRWCIARGLIGEPNRVFRVSIDDLFDLQRHIYKGISDSNLSNLFQMAKWYKEWRKKVEVH